MKYVILIHSNPGSRAIWDAMPHDERTVGLDQYRALNDDLTASGEMIVAHALADISLAKRVTADESGTLTTDGPFAEVKEHVAGLYLVECDSMERAVEIAARIPEARVGLVEVRPVMDLSAFEM